MTDEDLVAGILAGDRRALARAITLVESTRPDHRRRAEAVIDALIDHTGGAVRIGVSGAPGVGKSTFIERFGLELVEGGRRVAVLAIDPSSGLSGGSILGDKTRMVDLARHEGAYIRPSPSRGGLGGVARRTGEVLLLCEAAGFDTVVVETVGTGQSEVAVADLVDTFVLLVGAGGGDELQGVKRGIMELADLVVVTKADGDLAAAASRAVADHRHAVALLRRRHRGWVPQVVATSAVSGAGIGDVWHAVQAHRAAIEAADGIDALRRAQREQCFDSELKASALEVLLTRTGADAAIAEARAEVAAGHRTPWSAAAAVVSGLP